MCALAAATGSPAATSNEDRLARADIFRPGSKGQLIHNDEIGARWTGVGSSLWYKKQNGSGWEFIFADAGNGTRRPAFDHARMAAALAGAGEAAARADQLPITDLKFADNADGRIEVSMGARRFSCDLKAPGCTPLPQPAPASDRSIAPGGRSTLFLTGHNLWLEDRTTGAQRALTTDGTALKPYAAFTQVPVSRARIGIPAAPLGEFSPDGTRFLTFRFDLTDVPERTLIEHAPADPLARPIIHRWRQAYPGETPALAELLLVDLTTGAVTPVPHRTPAALLTPVAFSEVQWAADSRSVYFTDYSDLFRTRSLFRVDATTGRKTEVITDRAKTNQYSFVAPGWRLLTGGDILWTSERSGWQQIYRHGPDGRLRNAVTSGDWVVREILAVDEADGSLLFSAGGREPGRDPYYRHIYRGALKGGAPRLLTPEDADHEVRVPGNRLSPFGWVSTPPALSPDGRLFLDSFSRVDLPTQTVVRDAATGRIVMALETASGAPGAPAFAPPERFEALAADGRTPIHGIILKPSNFDPARRYRVIDDMYAGPQTIYAPKRYGHELLGLYGRDLAELGYVVVIVDGRGLPLRSRAYLDEGYGKMGKAGFLEDHVSAIRQLAGTRPWMDIGGGVGAYGLSAGGFSVLHALFDHPDFYKVGVAISPYDPNLTDWVWTARFQGTTDPKAILPETAAPAAGRLAGKLLIAHGDLDDVADPAGSLRVVDALVKANKSFDLLMFPGGDHQIAVHPYVLKRGRSHFLAHLPPAE